MNIIVKEQNEIFEKEPNLKDEENNLKFTHELKFDIDIKKEQKINFTKNPENSIMIKLLLNYIIWFKKNKLKEMRNLEI